MKVLLVCDRMPYPPASGVEITIAGWIDGLAPQHEVSVAVLHDGRGPVDGDRLKRLSQRVHKVYIIHTVRAAGWRRAVAELLLAAPSYYNMSFSAADVSALTADSFDVVIGSPAGAGSLCEVLKARSVAASECMYVLGISDVTSWAYWERGGGAPLGTPRRWIKRAVALPRAVVLALNERRYLRRFDAVLVQTPAERDRARRLLGPRSETEVVVAPNAANETLLTLPVGTPSGRDVLLLANLSPDRAEEHLFFIERVWPAVTQAVPDAKLHIVGVPGSPEVMSRVEAVPGVVTRGFVSDLACAFKGMRLSVISNHQTSGLATRVVDSLAAGVPMVGLASTVGTVEDITPGIEAVTVERPRQLAEAIIHLLQNPDVLDKMAVACRQLALRQKSRASTAHILGQSFERLRLKKQSRLGAHATRT